LEDLKTELELKQLQQSSGIIKKMSCNRDITDRNRNKGWRRQHFDDTVQHIISTCSVPTIELYIRRHGRVWVNWF